eukprot:78419_1
MNFEQSNTNCFVFFYLGSMSCLSFRGKICFNIKCYLYICKRHNSKHKMQHVNELTEQRDNRKLDTSESNYVSDHGKFVKTPYVIDTKQCKGDYIVKRLLDASTESVKILEIIEKYHPNIQNAAMYGKAMQKCNVLRDWNRVKNIMNLLMTNTNIKPTLTEFHVYMNSIARSNLNNSMEIVIECFNLIINTYKLIPDTITFSILLKTFKKSGKYNEAEKCWDIMINKYNLIPNELIYTQMISIYSKAHQFEKGKQIFVEYNNKISNNELTYHLPTINSYLDLCAEWGNFKEIQNILDIIQNNNNLCLDVIGITTVMKYCVSARKYAKCIEVIDKWLTDNNNNNTYAPEMLHLKCYSFAHLINSNNINFEEKYAIYSKLKDTIYIESVAYRLDITPIIAKTHLQGVIYLYAEYNPIEIVNVFEYLLNKQLIGYFKNTSIDLHGFQLVEAQFVIRYLFAYKLNELMELNNNNNKINIIVGKGKHASGEQNEKGILREFIIDEFLSWDPPIKTIVAGYNNGLLLIDKVE